MMKTLRSPLGKARGLGSNKIGSEHFLKQRFLVILLLPLVLWFIVSVAGLMLFGDYNSGVTYFSDVCAVTLAVVLLGTGFYHASNGLQNVFEDYIHCEISKTLAIYAVKILCLLTAVSGIIAVMGVYLKG